MVYYINPSKKFGHQSVTLITISTFEMVDNSRHKNGCQRAGHGSIDPQVVDPVLAQALVTNANLEVFKQFSLIMILIRHKNEKRKLTGCAS